MTPSGRVVLFGATGYTGTLTLAAMLGRGLRPVLMGRDGDRLAALAAEHELDHAVADADSVAGAVPMAGSASSAAPGAVLGAALQPGDVLVSTVGPFSRHGRAAVEAAVTVGAHYLDCTGEGPFIRAVFEEFGPRAAERGVALLPAFGYDFVPGNLAGALLLHRALAAGINPAAIDIGYFTTGRSGMSGGTRASAAGVLGGPGFTVQAAQLVPARPAGYLMRLKAGPRRRKVVTVAASEHFTLPRLAPGLRQVNVGLGWFGGFSLPMVVLSRFGLLGPLLRGLGALPLRAGSSGGPGPEERARSGSLVVADLRDGGNRTVDHVELAGPNGYQLTADLLAWGAATIAAGGLRQVGALGPVQAFGLGELTDACAALGLRELTSKSPPS